MSAPTEAHRDAAVAIFAIAMKSAHHGAPFREPCAQLIADSEARAVAKQVEALAILTLRWDKVEKEQDQLRARAEHAEAELATEQARLNWMEDNKRCYHVCIDRQPDGRSIHNSPPSLGSVRAAIDAAMKEGAK